MPNKLLVEVVLPEVKRTFEKCKHRGEDNIKTNMKEERYIGVDWRKLVQVRVQWKVLANTIMNVMVG